MEHSHITPHRSGNKYRTLAKVNIEPVPTAQENAPTTPGKPDIKNQYLVMVRYVRI